MRGITIELLSDKHQPAGFSCGKPTLDAWFAKFARTNQTYGFTRVLVGHVEGEVAGYYGLAPASIEAKIVPRSIRTGQPPDPIPCLLIGQLAVDLRHTGRGVGTALVTHALARCVEGAGIVGGRAIVVRAIDQEAERFWQSWDFIPSRSDSSLLLRAVENVGRWLTGIKSGVY